MPEICCWWLLIDCVSLSLITMRSCWRQCTTQIIRYTWTGMHIAMKHDSIILVSFISFFFLQKQNSVAFKGYLFNNILIQSHFHSQSHQYFFWTSYMSKIYTIERKIISKRNPPMVSSEVALIYDLPSKQKSLTGKTPSFRNGPISPSSK